MKQLIMLGASLAAVLVLALAARLLRLGGASLADADTAREQAEALLPGFDADEAWVGTEGTGALVAGTDGSLAAVRRNGARFVARRLQRPAMAACEGPVVVIESGERLLGPFVITLASEEEARQLTSMLIGTSSDA